MDEKQREEIRKIADYIKIIHAHSPKGQEELLKMCIKLKAIVEEDKKERTKEMEETKTISPKEEDCVYEMCPECDTEVKLKAVFKVQTCPSCGKPIYPCALCDHDKVDCSKCELGANQTKIRQEEEEN